MDNLNIDPRPLYEYDQIITHQELHELFEHVKQCYIDTPWWHFREKAEFRGSLVAVRMLLEWLHIGKPANVMMIMKRKGE